MSKFTKDEIDQLTDEEREGLAELEAEERAENGEDDAEADAEGGGDADAGAGSDAAAAEAAAAKPAAGDPPPAEQSKDTAAPPAAAPFPIYEMPADYERRISTLEQQRTELARQFDDGDLTGAEFQSKLSALNREETDLREAKLRAEISYDTQLEGWKQTATAFIQANPQYEPGSLLFKMLDEAVRGLQNNSERPFDPAILHQAHQQVQAELTRFTGAPQQAAGAQPAKGAPAGKTLPPPPAIPPSLATIPAAALEDTGQGSEFAHLDRLLQTDPLKYEQALAKLTDEQRERYEQGA
ncbi:hypothetical protein [Phreatobacter oligotrophus]|uniref:Uncharacterized protein n=1 Tax=Phreatobacter oligotrophus TaxID=1122261 RepID=A0A2T4ZIW4_9HYPH|nr:hypothetical protein [Phreatobacter oligotrophus]PTM61894.1 hypothetical protein C8P69_101566 [Phreatobacter oligotrophus]